MCLQKTTEALLNEHSFHVFTEDDGRGAAKEHFFVFTEDDGRGAAEGTFFSLCLQKTTVEALLKEHWAEYGRNFFTRYDYEGCDADPCNLMMEVRKYLENNS